MFNIFLPDEHVDSIYDITPAFLKKHHKKGVIVDLDNTLVPWNEHYPTDEVREWLETMRKEGIKVTIFSNNNEERVSLFTETLNIDAVHKANKPLQGAFKRTQQKMKLQKEDMVVIGDQLLTDVLGGNRIGFFTILVVPIVQSDAAITKFNRNMERILLNYFYKKGKLTRRIKHGK